MVKQLSGEWWIVALRGVISTLFGVVEGEFWLRLTGVASVVLGVALVLMPLAGLLAWVWVTAAYAIVFGMLPLALAFRLRGSGASSPTGFTQAGSVW